jgi:hypothetical protein
VPVIIDIGGAKGFEVVDPGQYPAKVSKAPEIAASKSTKGNWNINFEFELEDPQQKHWESRSLAANAIWRFKEELVNMGIDPPGALEMDELKEWLRETFPVGMELILDMTVEDDWNGKKDPKTGETLKQNRATMLLPDSSSGSGW